MTATGSGIKRTFEADGIQAMKVNKRKLMLRIVLIAIAMGALMTFCSCKREPVLNTIPIGGLFVSMNASWSPSGETIAVCWSGTDTTRKHGIYLVDTTTWETTGLLLVDDYSTFSTVNWSPGGEWLLFSYRAQLHKMKPDGDSLTQLTFTSRQFDSDWANSDTLIVYRISIGDSSGIWVMGEDGGSKRSLVRHGSSPSFAEGDSILYIESTDAPSKRAHLAILNIPDSSHRSIYGWTTGQPYTVYRSPQFSVVRREIAWSIDWNIWTIAMDGTSPRQLTSNGGARPDWSPDGQRIVFTKPTEEGGSLWIMNADGSGRMPVPGW
jgi:Tol biopolymer transport system component